MDRKPGLWASLSQPGCSTSRCMMMLMLEMVPVMSSPSTIRMLRKRSPGLSTWRRSRRREEGWAVTVRIRIHMIIMIIFIIIMIFIMMLDVTMATTVLIAERLVLKDSVRELLATASATGVYMAIAISAMFINITILTAMAFTRLLAIKNTIIRLLTRIHCMRLFSLSSLPAIMIEKGLNIFLVNSCFSLLWPTHSLAGGVQLLNKWLPPDPETMKQQTQRNTTNINKQATIGQTSNKISPANK